MPSHNHDADHAERRLPEELTIDHRPVQDEPGWMFLTIGVATLAAVLAMVLRSDWGAGLAAFALPALAAWKTWIPVHYRFTPLGIEQRVLGFQRLTPWIAFSRYELRSNGIVLLPLAERSVLGSLRGMYIPWGSRRADVLHQLEHHLARG